MGKNPHRYWRNASAEAQEGVVATINEYFHGREQIQRDEAMRSCGIAAQTLMLAAKEMGYDSCPMDLADMEAIGKLIKLPEDHVIAMFVAIGKGMREPRPGQLALNEVVLNDHF